jgi:hypothetical protein
MDVQIWAALIGIPVAVIGALAGKVPVEKWLSTRSRKRAHIPEIMKTQWDCDWFRADGSLQVNDRVTFSDWTKDNQFNGYGEAQYGDTLYKYSISGEVSPSRIVVLTYKAEKFPTGANVGMACFQLNGDATMGAGHWAGYTPQTADGITTYGIVHGLIKLKRVRKESD